MKRWVSTTELLWLHWSLGALDRGAHMIPSVSTTELLWLHWSCYYWWYIPHLQQRFHNWIVVAPLKLQPLSNLRCSGKSFPQLNCCGSIEACISGITGSSLRRFPQLNCCGSIEASPAWQRQPTLFSVSTTELLWLHWSCYMSFGSGWDGYTFPQLNCCGSIEAYRNVVLRV